jgi:predicted nucleotidyltransferase
MNAMILDATSMRMIRRILRQNVPESIEVFAFGSRVHGRSLKPFSDLDLCLRGKAQVSSGVLERLEAEFRDSDLPIKVDVIDWHRAARDFQAAIAGDLVRFPLDEDGAATMTR